MRETPKFWTLPPGDGRAGPRSRAMFTAAQSFIPGGVNSPVRAFRSVGGDPPYIRAAHGAHLLTEDGVTLIDYVGSWGPAILGHAHPVVIEAVTRAAQDGLSFGACAAGEVEFGVRGQVLREACADVPDRDLRRDEVEIGGDETVEEVRALDAVRCTNFDGSDTDLRAVDEIVDAQQVRRPHPQHAQGIGVQWCPTTHVDVDGLDVVDDLLEQCRGGAEPVQPGWVARSRAAGAACRPRQPGHDRRAGKIPAVLVERDRGEGAVPRRSRIEVLGAGVEDAVDSHPHVVDPVHPDVDDMLALVPAA